VSANLLDVFFEELSRGCPGLREFLSRASHESHAAEKSIQSVGTPQYRHFYHFGYMLARQHKGDAMHNGKHFPICPLCNEAVEVQTAKTDHDGKAVHEECYVQSLKAQPAKPAAAD
jgi:hypothetical protein